MDVRLFYSQNQWAGWQYWTDYLAWFLAVWGLGILALLLLLHWFFPGPDVRRDRHTVLLAVGAALIAKGMGDLPHLLFYRERPCVALDDAFNLLAEGLLPPFPASMQQRPLLWPWSWAGSPNGGDGCLAPHGDEGGAGTGSGPAARLALTPQPGVNATTREASPGSLFMPVAGTRRSSPRQASTPRLLRPRGPARSAGPRPAPGPGRPVGGPGSARRSGGSAPGRAPGPCR